MTETEELLREVSDLLREIYDGDACDCGADIGSDHDDDCFQTRVEDALWMTTNFLKTTPQNASAVGIASPSTPQSSTAALASRNADSMPLTGIGRTETNELPICAVCDQVIEDDPHLDNEDERMYHWICCPICELDE